MAIRLKKFRLREVVSYLTSRSAISVMKGVLAYTLIFVLAFLKGFEDLFTYPVAFTSAVVVSIACFPGMSVGACLSSVFLGLLGVSIGAFNFFILAELSHSPVGQAFVFFVMVYVLAYIKTMGLQYFGFALLCVLMSFQGIYTSILTGGFSKTYLLDYYRAYLWGSAVVVFVNVCVFPHSAERELRSTLVMSLDHIRTFAHLIGKTYRQDINEDEQKALSALHLSTRNDFGLLQMKLHETFIEINWSRWSVADYSKMVAQTRAMQQALITTYSSLVGVESEDLDLFHQDFLPGAKHTFDQIHKSVYMTLSGIQRELNVGPWRPGKEADDYKGVDLERAESRTATSMLRPEVGDDMDERMKAVQDRLAAELAITTLNSPLPSRRPSTEGATLRGTEPTSRLVTESNDEKKYLPTISEAAAPVRRPDAAAPRCVVSLQQKWEAFRDLQFDRMGDIIASGSLHGHDDVLLIDEPMPSVARTWGDDFVRGKQQTIDLIQEMRTSMSQAQKGRVEGEDSDDYSDEKTKGGIPWHHSLVRVYSFTFAMTQFVDMVIKMHDFTRGDGEETTKRRKRFHVHIFEGVRFRRRSKRQAAEDVDSELSMKEALAVLEGKEYIPEKVSIWRRVSDFETSLRSPNSICAFKTACAVVIFAVFFLVHTTQTWAVNYGITGGLLTITVALSPTLGQSFLSFIFQICGQSIGYVFGMVTLEIFKNVGGYRYNPYGIVVFLGAFSVPLMWIVYNQPKLFVLCLLALNSAGVLCLTEWSYRARPDFDSPPYRMAKGLTTLAVAVFLAAIFQLLILRNPARRTLRKAVARLMKENTTYTLILQAKARAAMPADPAYKASPQALQRVDADLQKRELRIQSEIIGLMPLLTFAGAEPDLAKRFDAASWIRIIRANQNILDRNRDARISIGLESIDEEISRIFVMRLSPYRRRATRYLRSSLYLTSTSLQAKFPLPHELPRPHELLPAFFHDALVLASRIAKSPDGLKIVKSPAFTRYWLIILSVTSIGNQLDEVEAACKTLFGVLEDDPSMSLMEHM